jgi:hypothetical protein
MAAGQRGLKELAQVGRKLEPESALDGDDFGIGQSGVELQSIPQHVTGRVLPDRDLGAAELVDEFLPGTGIHVRLRLHRRTLSSRCRLVRRGR